MPTDAKPVVKLVGTLSDQAANDQTNVTLSDQNVVDDLAPVVTASIVVGASGNAVNRDQVTISVTSTEPGTISGTARYVTSSGDNTLVENAASGTALSFSSTGTNLWEAVVKINSITNVANASGLVNVRVTVTDDSQNAGSAGNPESTEGHGWTG